MSKKCFECGNKPAPHPVVGSRQRRCGKCNHKPGYQIVNSCKNCKHVFRMGACDEGDKYFCNADGSERPRCGSALMGESFFDDAIGEYNNEAEYMWDRWETGRSVSQNGLCDNWTQKDGET